MELFSQYKRMLDCMIIMGKDMQRLTKILSEQQEQINSLTECVDILMRLQVQQIDLLKTSRD